MKIAMLGSLGLSAFYVIVDPEGAACVTQELLAMLADGARGLFAFIENLFG